MSPSIANKDIKSEIYGICTDIAKTPNELIDIENTRKLRKITNDRIFFQINHFLKKRLQM